MALYDFVRVQRWLFLINRLESKQYQYLFQHTVLSTLKLIVNIVLCIWFNYLHWNWHDN